MEFMNFIHAAVQSIVKNKMRTMLTMLGIIIGISSVIVMVSVGAGAQKQIQEQISSMGVNLLTIMPGNFKQGAVSQSAGSASRLTYADAVNLKKKAVLLSGVSPVVRTSVQIIGGTGNWSTTAYGVFPDYMTIRSWTVSDGSIFTENEVNASSKVCVIGQTVASNLYGTASPVGKMVRLGTVPFRIIGVLAAKGSSGSGQDQDDLVLAPYTTVQYRLSRFPFLQEILCSSVSSDQMDAAQAEIKTILREAHKVSDDADDPFTIRNQAEVISTATTTTGVLTAFLAAVAGISLLVGGIGIMNIMLVSVTERTREIGIRMAIGARGSDIMAQFLVEAVVLCSAGGIIGIILGFIVGLIVQAAAGWKVDFQIQTILLAFGFSFLVGIFFGFYPAKTASGLNPIEALRYE